MSAPVKRAVFTVLASTLLSAIATFFASTLARLIRHHRTEDNGDSVVTETKAEQ